MFFSRKTHGKVSLVVQCFSNCKLGWWEEERSVDGRMTARGCLWWEDRHLGDTSPWQGADRCADVRIWRGETAFACPSYWICFRSVVEKSWDVDLLFHEKIIMLLRVWTADCGLCAHLWFSNVLTCKPSSFSIWEKGSLSSGSLRWLLFPIVPPLKDFYSEYWPKAAVRLRVPHTSMPC